VDLGTRIVDQALALLGQLSELVAGSSHLRASGVGPDLEIKAGPMQLTQEPVHAGAGTSLPGGVDSCPTVDAVGAEVDRDAERRHGVWHLQGSPALTARGEHRGFRLEPCLVVRHLLAGQPGPNVDA
jgi:hypothetical protein